MKILQTWLFSCCLLASINPSLSASASTSSSSDTETNVADYVVIGVGTAGGLMAKRLSDDLKTSVIALHNGENLTQDPLIKYSKNSVFTVLDSIFGSPNPFANFLGIPPKLAQQLATFFGKEIAKKVPSLYITGLTPPQPDADDREITWVVSLPEGGASSVNAGAWCRGNNAVFSQWEAIAGPNWSVQRILELYKELEDYHGVTLNQFQHGYDGPIDVLQVKHPPLISKKVTEAVVNALNVPEVLDYNDDATPIGASSRLQYTQSGDHGVFRVSSATAFLNKDVMTPSGHGVKGRKLEVRFNSTATKIIWEGNTAVGVKYVQNGVKNEVYANKGVVVCAGLFSSPFLLHSGVGPASLLSSLGIPLVYDNPNVGQNLADQYLLPLIFLTNPKDAPPKSYNGIFSQISWLPAPGGNPSLRAIRLATANQIPGVALMLCDLIQPQSRGFITIDSANPLALPVVDPGYLSNPADLATYQATLSQYISAVNTQLHDIDPAYELIIPDPTLLNDPLYTSMYIQNAVVSNFCFQSHCLMAPRSQGGVVDSTGHVYGVNNLIVADTSVSPVPMNGTPMATAYLIALNIAKLLGH